MAVALEGSSAGEGPTGELAERPWILVGGVVPLDPVTEKPVTDLHAELAGGVTGGGGDALAVGETLPTRAMRSEPRTADARTAALTSLIVGSVAWFLGANGTTWSLLTVRARTSAKRASKRCVSQSWSTESRVNSKWGTHRTPVTTKETRAPFLSTPRTGMSPMHVACSSLPLAVLKRWLQVFTLTSRDSWGVTWPVQPESTTALMSRGSSMDASALCLLARRLLPPPCLRHDASRAWRVISLASMISLASTVQGRLTASCSEVFDEVDLEGGELPGVGHAELKGAVLAASPAGTLAGKPGV